MKKKVFVAATAVAAMTIMAGLASAAENKLLITDVLDQKEVKVGVEYQYSLEKRDYSGVGDIKSYGQAAELKAAVGVAKGLELGLSLPYLINSHNTVGDQTKDKWNDLTLSAKVGLDKHFTLPFSLAVGMDVKLANQSVENGGTGKVDYAPYIAASKQFDKVTPYISYKAVVTDDGQKGNDTHFTTIGAELELTKWMQLDTFAKAQFVTEKATEQGRVNYSFGIEPRFEVMKGLTVFPKVEYTVLGDIKDLAGTQLTKDGYEYKLGLGVSYLWK